MANDEPDRPGGREQGGIGLTVSNLTKRYGDFLAVDDMRFTVEPDAPVAPKP